MPKRSRQQQALEISILYEPHRHAQRLLHQAYAQLLPETRRRLVAGQPSFGSRDGAFVESTDTERVG